jgi:hypothetical protein
MTPSREHPFNTRAFVALVAALSVPGLLLTGYANHVFQFSPLTMERHAWMSAHNVLAALFAVFATWHVLLNRGALMRHVRGALRDVYVPGREAILAMIMVVLAVCLVVGHAFIAR